MYICTYLYVGTLIYTDTYVYTLCACSRYVPGNRHQKVRHTATLCPNSTDCYGAIYMTEIKQIKSIQAYIYVDICIYRNIYIYMYAYVIYIHMRGCGFLFPLACA